MSSQFMKSKFVKDLRQRKPELLSLVVVLVMAGFIAFAFGRVQAGILILWGVGLGWIVFATLSAHYDRKKPPRLMVGMDVGADDRVATVITERLSDGSLMILDSFDRPPADLDALLERMMDEPAISAAKRAYATVKKAADDPWDDTGWDEPWAAAVEAAFEWGLDDLREKRE